MRRSGKAKPVVWTWQARFMVEGVDGLLRDKTRPPGKPPLAAAIVRKVIDLVTGPPPGAATHWTGHEVDRSEEHTSELQSHLNLVCRLLLEKKNNTTTP